MRREGKGLRVNGFLTIPGKELRETASRSSGPGGQHVNKTNTRVTLRWNVCNTDALGPVRRARVEKELASRLTRAGDLVVHASRHRVRARNREAARERLAELLRAALARRLPRKATRPSRASRERALETKKRRSQVKQRRRRVDRDS
ncbi:MAG: alternative ribosome rescue aminoacyl-tRNA hydrolase ArfB [Myxococcota bacterium]